MPDMGPGHVQELKAAAFAGNPEALSQFSRCQQVAASVEGLSRAVLVLDAPLVQGMSQVRASRDSPSRQHQSSALQSAECALKRGHASSHAISSGTSIVMASCCSYMVLGL